MNHGGLLRMWCSPSGISSRLSVPYTKPPRTEFAVTHSPRFVMPASKAG